MQVKNFQTKITNEFKHVSHDECDTCANYAKLNECGSITVETLYRYGKPSTRTMEPELFWDLYEQGLV